MFLPSEDATLMELTFQDGQEALMIDALDIDNIIVEIYANGIPEDTNFYTEFCRTFKAKFKRTISKTAACFIIQEKDKIFNEAKKNLFQQPEQLDSMEPESLEQTPVQS